MRNSRSSNFIPVALHPVSRGPRTPARTIRKTATTQTDRMVLIKEENLNFQPLRSGGGTSGRMQRDYVKAINYINSCHKFLNSIIEKNSSEKVDGFVLPMVANFAPLFGVLTEKHGIKNRAVSKRDDNHRKNELKTDVKSNIEAQKVSTRRDKSEDRKSKSNFTTSSTMETIEPEDQRPGYLIFFCVFYINIILVGDFHESSKSDCLNWNIEQITMIIKEQIALYLNNLQIEKIKPNPVVKKYKRKHKNADKIIRKSGKNNIIEEEYLFEEIKSKLIKNSRTRLDADLSSDIDSQEIESSGITCRSEMAIKSTDSSSSDIKTDTDLEIKCFK